MLKNKEAVKNVCFLSKFAGCISTKDYGRLIYFKTVLQLYYRILSEEAMNAVGLKGMLMGIHEKLESVWKLVQKSVGHKSLYLSYSDCLPLAKKKKS